jgi:hypothetical protein
MGAYKYYIIINSTQTLIDDPIGWDSIELSIIRDKKYKGIFFPITSNLEFVGSAYTLLKNEYDLNGIEGNAELKIDYSCNTGFTEIYRGKFNFTEYIETNDDYCSIKCNIEPLGFEQKIKSRDDISIDMSSNQTIGSQTATTYTPFDLTIQGREILKRGEFETVTGETTNGPTNIIIPVTETVICNLPLSVKYDELLSGGNLLTTGFGDVFKTGSISPTTAPDMFNVSTTATYDFEYNLDGLISESIADSSSRTYNLSVSVRVNSTGGVYVINNFGAFSPSGGQQDYTINHSGTFSIALNSGDTVAFYVIFANYSPAGPPNIDASTFRVILDAGSYMRVSFASLAADSVTKAFKVYECASRTLEAITDTTDVLRSDYFGRTDSTPRNYGSNGCGALLALTQGLLVRGFDITEKPFYQRFDELFNFLWSVYNVALGIEKSGSSYVVRLENLEYFYDSTVIFTFENIKNITRSPMLERIYNKIELGFNNYGWEEGSIRVNTQDAFSVKTEFTNSLNSLNNSYTARTGYIADHYSIEYIRAVKFEDNPTSTTKFDSETFALCLKISDQTKTERDDNFSSVTGIFSPDTAMNLRISPKRNLLRHSNVINGSIAKKEGDISFVKTTFNTNLISATSGSACEGAYNNASLSEITDLSFNDINNPDGVPIFLPEMIEFESPFSYSDWLYLQETSLGKTNLYKTVKVTGNGIEYKGFIEELNWTPETGMAKVKMIRKYE